MIENTLIFVSLFAWTAYKLGSFSAMADHYRHNAEYKDWLPFRQSFFGDDK